jgi:hypothetical protein
MARSESQGLQIAVILLTMCVVGLAVATWVCYQSADANFKLKETADQRAAEADKQKQTEIHKATAYKYVIGVKEVTKADVEAAKGSLDAPTLKILDDFEKLAPEIEKATTENAKGLVSLPQYLVGAVAVRNAQLGDSQNRETTLTNEKGVTEKREQARAATAEQGMQKAAADLAGEREAFNKERDKFKKDLDDLKKQITTRDTQLKEIKEKSDKDLGASQLRIAELEKDVAKLRDKLANLTKDGPSFEGPDAQVTWVNQRQRMVWIDVGYADGLTRQTTFSIYDHDENGVSSAKRKARIEVIRVAEPHLAECRILEDEVKNPILPGDKAFTPAWSPGQHLHFALNGLLDIDGDGRPDNDEIKSIIELNGGVVDAELKPDGAMTGAITIQTRYLVRGKSPSEKSFSGEEGKRAFTNWSEMTEKAERYGVEIIEINRFLGMMGWKSQERTTTLGGKKTAAKRTEPSGRAASDSAAESAPAGDAPAKPAKETKKPAAEAEDDPFK